MLYDYIQTPPTCCSLCGGTLTTKAGFHGFYVGTVLRHVFGDFCVACWDRHGDKKGEYYEDRMRKSEPSQMADHPDAIYADWRDGWLKKFDVDVNDLVTDGILNVFMFDPFPEIATRGHVFKIVSWEREITGDKISYIKFHFYVDKFMFMANIPCACLNFWHTVNVLSVWNQDEEEFEVKYL